ncbi:MAG: ABC transporter ATP-binding protein [Acidobacteria bacterium]|nr:ABC transporter ATP-binding protein [Acidobacteriota bacterium]
MTRDDGVVLQDVCKSFSGAAGSVDVLRGVSIKLAGGEAAAITGPSGSGKSTLLHLLGGLDRPTSGSITIHGRRPADMTPRELSRFRNRTIGFVFQDHHLLPQYSVLENVLLPTYALGRPAAAAQGRATGLLEDVGMGHRLHHRPAELSGGERQRTAVARALMNGPRLLLCDEPTGSLDSANAEAVGQLLLDMHRREGNILVVVTHNPNLAARFRRRFQLVEGRCSAA